METRSRERGPRRPTASAETYRFGAPGLVLIGLILGLAGGLFYAWLVNPVSYREATPAGLSPVFKEEYVLLVSQSYAADGDWAQVLRRLNALAEPDLTAFARGQLESALRQGRDPAQVRHMAAMAARLGVEGPAVAIFAPTTPGATPTLAAGNTVPTLTPTLLPTITPTLPPTQTPTPSPSPTRTPRPTATPAPAFRLLAQERACLTTGPVTEIQVTVVDGDEAPLPGVAVLVSWESGDDQFFTGFKAEEDPGYGDFTMAEGVSYSVTLAEGSPTVSGLRLEPCPQRDGGFLGGWRLTFQRLGDSEE
jgi:hypothetical protein